MLYWSVLVGGNTDLTGSTSPVDVATDMCILNVQNTALLYYLLEYFLSYSAVQMFGLTLQGFDCRLEVGYCSFNILFCLGVCISWVSILISFQYFRSLG